MDADCETGEESGGYFEKTAELLNMIVSPFSISGLESVTNLIALMCYAP
jgi:hypothetical protein